MVNENSFLPGVLAIGGSDPSAGAGIQADLKTFATLHTLGFATVTCLTVQHSAGVTEIQPLDPLIVSKQVEIILARYFVTHIKTGMIGTIGIAEALGELLHGFTGQLVCDPVFFATDGTALLAENARDAFTECIIKNATVITPNQMEFDILTRSAGKPSDPMDAILNLFHRYPRLEAIVLKGGHFNFEDEVIVDRLFLRSMDQSFLCRAVSHPRRFSVNLHGTGCTFASAYSAEHLRSGDHHKSFATAVAYVDSLLKASESIRCCEGTGPVLHHLYRDNP